ncbi:hypothetical protein KKA53_03875 [Candidatus Dependentiae bacterium]|nr:hypothetical protein [Candidatus Dependentiae bacterium]
MRYAKLALLFAIAMTPWLAQARTMQEIYGPGFTGKITREQTRTKTAEKEAKIISISNTKGDTSKVEFVRKEPFMANLTESRGLFQTRKNIKDDAFKNNYTNSYINSRKNITDKNFVKIMAEVYFCLLYKGIQDSWIESTKNTTYEFIDKAESVKPKGSEDADRAMKMVLTRVANNERTPDGQKGKPLHKSGLSSSRTKRLIGLYVKYGISYIR